MAARWTKIWLAQAGMRGGRQSVMLTLLLLLWFTLMMTGCGASGRSPWGERASLPVAGERASLPAISGRAGFNPPSIGQLQSILRSELARLGKSASDTTPHAPTGATNAAFDFAAAVIDPDGSPDGAGGGELPPTGITLSWTERLLGDYDENGQVNAADLAPLGMNWQQSVTYGDAALHGGVAYWPAGDPLDDGGSGAGVPPANGSGAQNWRRARVDGKEDGLLNAQDVMPIAAHWYEQSAGYRVYAKLPGDTEFHMLPNPDDAASPLTIPRAKAFPVGKTSADTTRPVSFSFSYEDGRHGDPPHQLPDGRYEFYTAAYDATTDTDGPASTHLALDINAGVANQLPVARLSVSPDFAGAPAIVTFDASQSADPDGSIVEYRWDFDADGIVDWSTADAKVPDKSSGGEVDTITPGTAPGPGLPPSTVMVTYRQGYDHYFYPSVTVVDDRDGKSLVPKPLGVSGWVSELMSSSIDALDPLGEVQFKVSCIEQDPSTGEVVVAGYVFQLQRYGTCPEGVYFARRKASGIWETELVMDKNTPAVEQFNEDTYAGLGRMDCVSCLLAWAEDGEPIVIPSIDLWYNTGDTSAVFVAVRNTAGGWDSKKLYAGESPPFTNPSGARSGIIYILQPGHFAALGGYAIGSSMPPVTANFLLWYDNGNITLDSPGLDPDGNLWEMTRLARGNVVEYYMFVKNSDQHALDHSMDLLHREGVDKWKLLNISIAQAWSFTGITYNRGTVIYDNNDFGFYVLEYYQDGEKTSWYWVRTDGVGTFQTTVIEHNLNNGPADNIRSNGSDVTIFSESDYIDGHYPDQYHYYFDIVEATTHTHEIIYTTIAADDDKFLIQQAANSNGGRQAWWVGEGHSPQFINDDMGQFLFTRVDPRV